MDFLKNITPEGSKCPECGESQVQCHEGVWMPSPCACKKADILKFERAEARQKAETRQMRYERLFGSSTLGKRFKRRTLNNFNKDLQPKAFNKVTEYIKNFENELAEGKGMLIEGPIGTGKTHLAGAVVNNLRHQGYGCIFGTLGELLGRVKATFNNKDGPREGEIMSALKKAPLLVIDDIGKESRTDFLITRLGAIVNARYENELPIILTTNFNSKLLTEYVRDNNNLDSIYSRLYEICHYHYIFCVGKDYRRPQTNHT